VIVFFFSFLVCSWLQFFITTEVTSWVSRISDEFKILMMTDSEMVLMGVFFFFFDMQLDGKHVVFGEVTDGFEVVKKIEALGSMSGKPKTEVVVEDCGVY
jgi:cyclophilin family peptidyl-prolyl cis-trans isomerase